MIALLAAVVFREPHKENNSEVKEQGKEEATALTHEEKDIDVAKSEHCQTAEQTKVHSILLKLR